jgi:hypothetical protein
MITKIAVVGQQCSGKTSAAKIFKKYFDSTYIVKIADPIYDTLNALKQDKHRAFMQQFADLAKEHFGEQVLVDVFRQNVKDLEKQSDSADIDRPGGPRNVLIACDDIRFPYELETVKKELGFKLVGINAERTIRKVRAERLGLDFIENHNSETLVPQLFQYCDYTIFDDGLSMEGLEFQCRKILSQINPLLFQTVRPVS